MGLLHVLAELKQPALITLGDVSLRVDESDRDAAVALLAFTEEYIEEGKTTYGDAEAILIVNFLNAIADAPSLSDSLKDRRVRAMLDCLWWFRFLVASRPKDDDADLTNSLGA